jgi:hypothetical protein
LSILTPSISMTSNSSLFQINLSLFFGIIPNSVLINPYGCYFVIAY